MVTRMWSGSSVQSRGRHTWLMLPTLSLATGYCYFENKSFSLSAVSGCLLQTRLCVVSVQTSLPLLSKHTLTGLHCPRAGWIGLTPAALAAVQPRQQHSS